MTLQTAEAEKEYTLEAMESFLNFGADEVDVRTIKTPFTIDGDDKSKVRCRSGFKGDEVQSLTREAFTYTSTVVVCARVQDCGVIQTVSGVHADAKTDVMEQYMPEIRDRCVILPPSSSNHTSLHALARVGHLRGGRRSHPPSTALSEEFAGWRWEVLSLLGCLGSFRRHRVHPELPWPAGEVYSVAVHLRRGDILSTVPGRHFVRGVVSEAQLISGMEQVKKAVLAQGVNGGQPIVFHVFTQVGRKSRLGRIESSAPSGCRARDRAEVNQHNGNRHQRVPPPPRSGAVHTRI